MKHPLDNLGQNLRDAAIAAVACAAGRYEGTQTLLLGRRVRLRDLGSVRGVARGEKP